VPWRGPEVPGEFPTLGYLVADWIEANCAIPDGEQAGDPFVMSDEQLRFVLWHYRLKHDTPDQLRKGSKPSSAFVFRRSQLVEPQKWGKGPLSAAVICAEANGPVLFDGWDADGEPVGKPWPTPWIQVTAVSEDQTDNVWQALVPMIELGALNADIPDTGVTRINIQGHGGSTGKIEPVTSAAVSRLGQRITFALQDETHAWTESNGGHKLADTQRRNLGGMGGRSMETTNAWDPTEESVAQVTYERAPADVYRHYPKPIKGSIRNKAERRKALRHAYQGAPWVDVDRIDAEVEELLAKADPNQAERFYLNRIVAGADKAFDQERFEALYDEAHGPIAPGRLVTVGFDGSKRRDATGVVVTDVETGYQQVVGVWERPMDAGPDWQVSETSVDTVMTYVFENWTVWRLYGDPPYWETMMDTWASRWGEEQVVQWWTNQYRRMALALAAYYSAIQDGDLTHDGDEVLVRHVGNAVKRLTRMRDEDDNFLWVISKESAASTKKIDVCMASVLSWEARGDALRAGALDQPEYGMAVF
jgi:hypothetical protein